MAIALTGHHVLDGIITPSFQKIFQAADLLPELNLLAVILGNLLSLFILHLLQLLYLFPEFLELLALVRMVSKPKGGYQECRHQSRDHHFQKGHGHVPPFLSPARFATEFLHFLIPLVLSLYMLSSVVSSFLTAFLTANPTLHIRLAQR